MTGGVMGGGVTATAILPHSFRQGASRRDPSRDVPVVFLHGFGGDRTGWDGLTARLDGLSVVAFDLPGHGAALDWPVIGHAGEAAKAVQASLDGLGLGRVHLVGHSMGGAIAAILALRLAGTGRVASATLIAPGGFGPEIDAGLLRDFAAATAPDDLARLYGRFFAPGFAVSEQEIAAMVAARRADPRVGATLARIAGLILDGDGQKSLDLGRIAALPHPVSVIWGDADAVVPVTQARRAPAPIAATILPGIGHMPHLEAAAEVAAALRATFASVE